MKYKFFVAIFTLLLCDFVFSQGYDGEMCKKNPNLSLKKSVKKGFISEIMVGVSNISGRKSKGPDISHSQYLATSTLLNLKNVPTLSPKTLRMEEPADEDRVIRRDLISCRFSAYYAMDGDSSTAWSEGEEGDGIGEMLIAIVDIRKPIKIWIGFGRSENSFFENNRPKRIRIHAFEAQGFSFGLDNVNLHNNKLLGSSEVELNDVNDYQKLTIPIYQLKGISNESTGFEKHFYSFIAIEILEVYKGSKYSDTLISEVQNIK
ncbi:NADase-type glycan-binding domain-containing protein [Leptospira dzoumogneensis]|uniref:NAD glycohydrolase translocation F5/8 type C domain-containing protein n=1 Tax=Leptospira dzoumogneensis TaxID=2484904 RepID=A0A4Z1ATN3_9LEPT|nr:hypothetical protein [Leptospira dzoumogneensis]TGM98983.1 hypothetical protein EHR06_10970 [Leptospira dzoumogneensis]